MTSYFIAPYEPTDNPERWDALVTARYLIIDPNQYQRRLLDRWPHSKFFKTSETLPLQWSLYLQTNDGNVVAGPIGELHADRQVVSLDTPYEEFFLWHRSIIPSEHKLFLFNDSSWDSLELKFETTLEEIKLFVRGRT